MSPSREINGNRPSPLKIHKHSTVIKKPSVSSTSTTTSSTASLASSSSVSSTSHRQPVIIYTHSPKVIHTQPCDFMALVQKLTGFSSSSNDDNNNPTLPFSKNDNIPPVNKKRKTSLGKKKEESIKPSLDDGMQLMASQSPSVTSATTNLEFKPLLSDIPLFTQGFSSEFFDLPSSSYKYTELPGISPMSNINKSTSKFSDI